MFISRPVGLEPKLGTATRAPFDRNGRAKT
jgi:hypothetical protein